MLALPRTRPIAVRDRTVAAKGTRLCVWPPTYKLYVILPTECPNSSTCMTIRGGCSKYSLKMAMISDHNNSPASLITGRLQGFCKVRELASLSSKLVFVLE